LVLSIPPLSDEEGDDAEDGDAHSPVDLQTRSRLRRPPYRAIRISPYDDDDEDEVSSR
jgi:peptide alpha-N-acetyltransferase